LEGSRRMQGKWVERGTLEGLGRTQRNVMKVG